MRILVTGSEGFIGRHTVDALRDIGHEVYGLDKKTGDDISVMNEGTRHLIAVAKPSYIIHLASSVSTPGSIASPIGTYVDTVATAVNVLEAARSTRTPVLITSSVKARDGKTPYGAAKRMVELWAQEYAAAYRVPVLINRPGTVYGPGQEGSTESGWIAWFLKAKREHLAVTINGSGEQVRDLLHVSDYVDLMQLQIGHHVLGVMRWDGRIWDVGGGWENAISVNKMVEALGLPVTYGPERYGDAMQYVGRNTYPGWSPSIAWRTSDVFVDALT